MTQNVDFMDFHATPARDVTRNRSVGMARHACLSITKRQASGSRPQVVRG